MIKWWSSVRLSQRHFCLILPEVKVNCLVEKGGIVSPQIQNWRVNQGIHNLRLRLYVVCVWETGDRKSSPLSSRRQPTFTNHLSVLIAAITQGDNNTHSSPDPPENSLLLRIIGLYCIYSAATVWTTKWARWDSGWTDRLRICPDYAVIGSQADRHGGNPAEGNTSQGGRHDTAGQHVNGAPTNAREGFLRATASVPSLFNQQRNNCSGSALQHPPRHQLTRLQSIIWVFNNKFRRSYLSSTENTPISSDTYFSKCWFFLIILHRFAVFLLQRTFKILKVK